MTDREMEAYLAGDDAPSEAPLRHWTCRRCRRTVRRLRHDPRPLVCCNVPMEEILPDRSPDDPAAHGAPLGFSEYDERVLLDEYAGLAMAALFPITIPIHPPALAARAWDIAEAMVAERRRRLKERT